jgi:hypothetical protein
MFEDMLTVNFELEAGAHVKIEVYFKKTFTV